MIWIDIGMVLGKEESERLAGPFDRGRSSRLLAGITHSCLHTFD